MTRRDLGVAGVAIIGTLALMPRARSQGTEQPVMGSTAVDWARMKATPTKTGEVRSVFRAPTATLDELEAHITTLNPGESPHPPHKHPDEEILFLKEGTLEATLNGQTVRVGPGSVLFQASNQLHTLRNVGTAPATYFVMRWNSPGMLKKKAIAE